MAEAKLQIIIDASGGNARAELGALQKDLKQTGAVATESSDKQVAANKRVGISMADVAGGVAVAKQAFALLEQGLQATVGKTVEYGEQVRNLKRDMGASAEEASMLIQAGDDVGVSYDALRLAAKKLNAEGLEPNIETLSKMADEYMHLPSDVAKAQYAADKFGQRAGPEMQKLLEQGSVGLKGLAQDAKDAGLVMSGEAVEGAHELWKAQDDLNDAMQAAALTIGVELVPMMVDLAGFAKKDLVPALKWAADTFVDGWEAGHKLWQVGELLFIQWQRLTGMIDWETAALEAQKVVNDGLTDSQVAAAKSAAYWASEMEKAAGGAEHATAAVESLNPAIDEAAVKADYLADRTRAIADAHDDMLKSHRTWLDGVAGDVVNALHDAGVEGELYLAALHGIDATYGTSLASEDEYHTKLAAITAEFAKTHDVTAYEIALKALADGGASEAAAKAEDAANKVALLNSEIYKLPTDTHISITTDYYSEWHASGGGQGGYGGGAAGGADFIVPPGFPNDSFPLRVQSGEHVLVEPAGSWDAPPMGPFGMERRGNSGMSSQAEQGADDRPTVVQNLTYHTTINDKLAVALWEERQRQHRVAHHNALMA